MMEKKIATMKAELERAENILVVYNEIERNMQWQTMEVVIDDNGNTIYNAPNEDDYRKPLYDAYREVMAAVEKLIK